MQDARGQQFVESRQQGQNACKSPCKFRRNHAETRSCHDFARAFSGLIQVLNDPFQDDADGGFENGVRDGSLDARDVKTQGVNLRERCSIGVVPKQSRQSTFLTTCKDMFLL